MEKSGKKKLFGIFNAVDIIIILVVLVLVVFAAYKILTPSAYSAKTQEITYRVHVAAMPKETYDNIAALLPAAMMASGVYADGTVVSVEEGECKLLQIEHSYGPVTEPDREYVSAVFTLKANVDMNLLITEVGTQEVRAGRAHIVKTRYFEVTGTVLTVDWPE